MLLTIILFAFFFFNDTATTEIYTLSLHDALPISAVDRDTRTAQGRRPGRHQLRRGHPRGGSGGPRVPRPQGPGLVRSEEHTSELQSRLHLVCRLLLEKKKKKQRHHSLVHDASIPD